MTASWQKVFRYPKLLIAIALLITLASLWHVKKVEIGNSLQAVLDKSAALQEYENFKIAFGSDEVVLCHFGTKGIDYSSMMRLFALVEEVKKLPHVEAVTSFLDAIPREERQNRRYFDNYLKRKGTLEILKKRAKDIRLARSRLVAKDLNGLAIVALLKLPPGNMGADQSKRKKIIEEFKNLVLLQMPDKPVHFLGYPVVESAVLKLVEQSNEKLMPLAVAIGAIIILVIYRRFTYMFAAIAAVLLSLFWLVAAFPLADYTLNPFSTMLFPLVLAIGLTITVHLLSAFQRLGDDASEEAIKEIFPPSLLCTLTTFIGFLSLVLNEVDEIRNFGIFAALGSFLCLFSIFTLVPAIIALRAPMANNTGRWGSIRMSGRLAIFVKKVIYSRKINLLLFIGALAICALGLKQLPIKSAAIMGFYEDNPTIISKKIYEKKFERIFALEAIIKLPKLSTAFDLSNYEALGRFQKELLQSQGVSSSLSLRDLMLDVAYGTVERPLELKTKHDIGKIKYLLEPRAWQPLLKTFATKSGDTLRVHVTLKVEDAISMVKLAERVRTLALATFPKGTDVKVTGRNFLSSLVHLNTMKNELYCFLLAIAVIVLVLVVSFRSLSVGLLCSLPNIIPLIFTFGVMGWLEIPFNVSTGMILCVTIGIIVDDTIHFLFSYKKFRQKGLGSEKSVAHAAAKVGKPILATTVILSFGMAVLWFSPFKMVGQFGLFTALTIIFALVADLVLLPLLLTMFPNVFSKGE